MTQNTLRVATSITEGKTTAPATDSDDDEVQIVSQTRPQSPSAPKPAETTRSHTVHFNVLVLSVLGSLHTKSGVPTKRPSYLPLDSTTGINTRRRIDDEGEGGENFVLTVRSAHWKKGQTPRDRTVDTTQSGPPLPGRTRLVLRFEKDANLADNWNPVVPPIVPLDEDADEGENRSPEVGVLPSPAGLAAATVSTVSRALRAATTSVKPELLTSTTTTATATYNGSSTGTTTELFCSAARLKTGKACTISYQPLLVNRLVLVAGYHALRLDKADVDITWTHDGSTWTIVQSAP